jgi:hypothetical protein
VRYGIAIVGDLMGIGAVLRDCCPVCVVIVCPGTRELGLRRRRGASGAGGGRKREALCEGVVVPPAGICEPDAWRAAWVGACSFAARRFCVARTPLCWPARSCLLALRPGCAGLWGAGGPAGHRPIYFTSVAAGLAGCLLHAVLEENGKMVQRCFAVANKAQFNARLTLTADLCRLQDVKWRSSSMRAGAFTLRVMCPVACPDSCVTAVSAGLACWFGRRRLSRRRGAWQRRGWQIGSGPVESTCKAAVASRKGGGMRWGSPAPTLSSMSAPFSSPTHRAGTRCRRKPHFDLPTNMMLTLNWKPCAFA